MRERESHHHTRVGVLAISFTVLILRQLATLQTQIVPASFAISHVTVINTENGSSNDDMTVIVTGDRIADVGKSNAVNVPAVASVLDARGKFLLPGLWDMHVHVFNNDTLNGTNSSEYFLPLFVANGVLGVRDMSTDADDIVEANRWNQDIAAGRLVGPRVLLSSQIVDGDLPVRVGPPTVSNALVVRTPEEGRAAVRSLKASGAKLIKVYWNLSRDVYFAIAVEAKREGIPFGGHVPRVVDPGEAADAGQRSIEHMDGIYAACSQRNAGSLTANEQAALTGVFDRSRCEALADRLQQNGIWLVPTSINFWDPVDVDLRRRQQYGPPLAGTPFRRASPPPLVVNVHQSMHRVESFLTGTDISIRRAEIVPGVSLHEELALFVEMGFTPAEALKAATVNPAKYAGMLDEFGTIAKNKRADLVLVDANPLADVRNASRISAVVLNGRVFDRTELDRLLARSESAARNIRPTPFLSIRIFDANASSRFAGTWNADYPVPQPIMIDVTLAGTSLNGTIQAGGQRVPVAGMTNGDEISFTFTSPDNDRTIMINGRLSGDELAFTRSVEVRPGGRPGGAGFFGSGGQNVTFVARRAP